MAKRGIQFKKRFSNLFSGSRKRISKLPVRSGYRKSVVFVRKRPIAALLAGLALLFLVIALGNLIAGQKQEEQQEEIARKQVQVFTLGKSPTVRLQASIEKKGVIKISALSGGIVSSIPVTEGQKIKAGAPVVHLGTNYNGASLPGAQAQLARAQYNNVVETYDTQKDLVSKQREVAEKTSENTEELRKISESSLSDTRSLLDLNTDALNQVNSTITQLEQIPNPSEEQIQALSQARQARLQLESGVAQLRGSVRNLEYSTNKENPPTELAGLQKDITLKQLDLQEKALDLNKEVSRLQYNIASISESLMHPASPFDAIVERVHVQPGQQVGPGTPLVTISCLNISATAVINAPRKFALAVSQVEPSILTTESGKVSLYPTYISTVATDGVLYSIIYSIPNESLPLLTDEGYVPIDVPIAFSDTAQNTSFIPIDSVYQSQDSAYVNIVSGDTVKTRKVSLGTVYGKYVEVLSGVNNGDQIILNRNVISGDRIEITR